MSSGVLHSSTTIAGSIFSSSEPSVKVGSIGVVIDCNEAGDDAGRSDVGSSKIYRMCIRDRMSASDCIKHSINLDHPSNGGINAFVVFAHSNQRTLVTNIKCSVEFIVCGGNVY